MKIQISEQQQNLFGVIVKDEYDYLIMNFRRAEILMFLIELFKKNNWKMFEKEFTSNIQIRNRGATHLTQINDYHNIKMNGDLQEGFVNAFKIGYLELSKEKTYFDFLLTSPFNNTKFLFQ